MEVTQTSVYLVYSLSQLMYLSFGVVSLPDGTPHNGFLRLVTGVVPAPRDRLRT